MVFDLNSFRRDPDKTEKGVWVTVSGDTKIRIGYIKSERFRRVRDEKLSEKITAKGANLTPQEIDNILTEVAASEILLGWLNLKLDGETITYSAANALKILQDKSLSEFREFVFLKAEEISLFKTEKVKQKRKNSKPRSGGG